MSINIIGIAGYMGSGKSTCIEMLLKNATAVFDADILAKEFMCNDLSIMEKMISEFGADIYQNKMIDFKILGKIVFNDCVKLRKLNKIVHPPFVEYLRMLIDKKVQEHGDQVILLDAALIPLWKIESWFDHLIWVDASNEVRLMRLSEKYRGTIKIDELNRRINEQQCLFGKSDSYKWNTIQNNLSIDEYKNSCFQLFYNLSLKIMQS